MNQNFVERRIMGQLCEYWKQIQGGNKFPKKSDLDVDEIGHIMPYCVVVDVHQDDGKIDYHVGYVGSKVRQFADKGIFHETFIQFVSPDTETFQEYLDEVLETQEPMTDSGEALNGNQEEVRFRQCILPLSDDGEKVTSMICAVNCKIY
ncbi:sensory box protein [Neorickettsia helminthoeca str. Oregon]|uniref:Sensory box protein n=1 Tax=Neorickettsia helminthoeca str. Oregon TaxID=1286528 RepID=X5H3Q0_9RICK|nr:PAS domain-containing protein [Neorickettsia helminthoeca]AHX11323.1 sensory box protein [Neorickettsia helminthoeca str. Oregon]